MIAWLIEAWISLLAISIVAGVGWLLHRPVWLWDEILEISDV